jgi:hypothetical protein
MNQKRIFFILHPSKRWDFVYHIEQSGLSSGLFHDSEPEHFATYRSA